MRFVDLLRSTVLLSAGAATMLGVVAVITANLDDDAVLVLVAAGWWVVATLIGGWLGRRTQASPAIQRALREARASTMLPEIAPARILLNRLWPLLVVTVVAAATSLAIPQVAAVAAGFGLLWALSMRHQELAVTAVEERDGVTFFVDSTTAFGTIRLVRTPGLRRDLPPAHSH
ncbi:unannotated protein [freshwater metagenome]|uniref:Unannotated protein n=1 Tax=freshwater metagenome TaxID=449393 RepID=A0A6J7HJY7_9ZZZZ|nr:hypothetical protein [Actinomycetota bacterium]